MSDMLKSRMEMQELAKQYDIRPVPPKPAELPGAAVQVRVCLDGGALEVSPLSLPLCFFSPDLRSFIVCI